jgi:chorismate mutase / prephenate dehydrogenase
MDTKNSIDVTEELEHLRKKIDAIDSHIVEQLARRREKVKKIVALKKEYNLPVFHPAREENLISSRRKQGKAAGLCPDHVEDIFRTMLRQSRTEQTARMTGKGVLPGAVVLIVGGGGQMGQYFSRLFLDTGYQVRILDQDNWKECEWMCQNISLALISVPIEKTAPVIKKIAPYLPPGCLLADITSVKKMPLATMLKAYSGPVVGLHPLFGATPATLDKQVIVTTPGRDQEACRWLLTQFSAWGAVVVSADAREHDEIMDIVQALRHFATFAFGKFLMRRQVNISRSLEFSSPIYRLELGMVGRLFDQDPDLYSEIIFASPERRNLLKMYIAEMNENLSILENDDKERFRREFKKISDWFGPFSEQALRESSYLIDKLIERF